MLSDDVDSSVCSAVKLWQTSKLHFESVFKLLESLLVFFFDRVVDILIDLSQLLKSGNKDFVIHLIIKDIDC